MLFVSVITVSLGVLLAAKDVTSSNVGSQVMSKFRHLGEIMSFCKLNVSLFLKGELR